jgi:DNA-binding CsgD family transcriptional regulator
VAAGPPLFFALTLCLMWTGEYQGALGNCENTIAASRERGAAAPLQMALGQRAELKRRLGDWVQARADAEESIRLAHETGQAVQGFYPYVIQLRLEAALGLDGALSRVDEMHAIATAAKLGSVLAYLSAGELLAALTSGDVAKAVERGRHTRDLLDEQGMRDPSVIQWRADFVEALVRASETDEAAAETRIFSEQAAPTEQAWANAAAARCRGLTADEESFAGAFEQALEWHARGADPFERARTELAYGERLRRAQRPSEARGHLRAALEVFEALEAEPWARKVRGELRASGAAAPPSRAPVSRELTAQELEVALIVGGGATNREAAASLFLSPKTVEAHLGRIYRKLGVRSRTELAALMGRDQTDRPV